MKSSIKFLAIMALLFTFSFAAHAQRGGGKSFDPEHMAERETTHMIEKLTLDETQAAKVKDINLTYAKKMHEAREEHTGNRSAIQEVATAIEKEKAAEMKTVLTGEQYKTFEKMQAEQANRKGRKGGRKRGSK